MQPIWYCRWFMNNPKEGSVWVCREIGKLHQSKIVWDATPEKILECIRTFDELGEWPGTFKAVLK